MIVAMVAHASQYTSMDNIYHVGSSLRNPINFSVVHNLSYQYFTKNPLINKDGKPIKVVKATILTNMATFWIYMLICFLLPLKVCSINLIICLRNIFDIIFKSKKTG